MTHVTDVQRVTKRPDAAICRPENSYRRVAICVKSETCARRARAVMNHRATKLRPMNRAKSWLQPAPLCSPPIHRRAGTRRQRRKFLGSRSGKGSLPCSTGILRLAQNDCRRRPTDFGQTRILFERYGQINLCLNDNLPQAELAVVGLRRAGGWGDLRHILLQVAPLPPAVPHPVVG